MGLVMWTPSFAFIFQVLGAWALAISPSFITAHLLFILIINGNDMINKMQERNDYMAEQYNQIDQLESLFPF